MSKGIDLEKERDVLDRQITFFHFEKAKEKINKCLKEAKKIKDYFYLFYFTAQKFIIQEDFEKALRYFDLCLKTRPDDGYSYNEKAICLAELKRYDEAFTCFDKGIRTADYKVSLYHNKGWLLNSLGKFRQSIICFEKALEFESDRVESNFSLGDSYLHLGDKVKARKYFNRSLGQIKGKSSYIYKEIKNRLR